MSDSLVKIYQIDTKQNHEAKEILSGIRQPDDSFKFRIFGDYFDYIETMKTKESLDKIFHFNCIESDGIYYKIIDNNDYDIVTKINKLKERIPRSHGLLNDYQKRRRDVITNEIKELELQLTKLTAEGVPSDIN